MKPEECYAMHQRAFRCAFDFLNAHFPPGMEPEWWTQASEEIAKAADEQPGNQLAVFLLMGVWDYLNDEYKRRMKDAETGA